jgi:hypothetical protein
VTATLGLLTVGDLERWSGVPKWTLQRALARLGAPRVSTLLVLPTARLPELAAELRRLGYDVPGDAGEAGAGTDAETTTAPAA